MTKERANGKETGEVAKRKVRAGKGMGREWKGRTGKGGAGKAEGRAGQGKGRKVQAR